MENRVNTHKLRPLEARERACNIRKFICTAPSSLFRQNSFSPLEPLASLRSEEGSPPLLAVQNLVMGSLYKERTNGFIPGESSGFKERFLEGRGGVWHT